MRKREKIKQDKAFIQFLRCYPECDVVEKKEGVFLKLYRMEDADREIDKENYEEGLLKLLEFSNQLFYFEDAVYLIEETEADIVDEAVFKADEYFEQISLKEWFRIICKMSGCEEFDWEKKKGLKQHIQPYGRKTEETEMWIGEQVNRTVMLDNFPSKIFSGMMSEVMNISKEITASVYIDKINVEHCLEVAEEGSGIYQYMSELKDDIYNCCVLLNVKDEKVLKKIEGVVHKYYVSVNYLENQQNQGWLSVLPLCDDRIGYRKALKERNILGLLRYSWINRLHSGVCYGKDLYYNRLTEKNSGFYLGGNVEDEIRQLPDDVKIAVFTLNGKGESLKGCKILSDNLRTNQEILRCLFYGGSAHFNILERHKDSLESALKKSRTYDDFVRYGSEIDSRYVSLLEKRRELMSGTKRLEQKRHLCVYVADAETEAERLLQIMGGVANCDADVIYILCGTELAKVRDNHFIELLMNQKERVITVTGKNTMAMLGNNEFKLAIKNSEFKYVGKCDIQEKVNLGALLSLSKEQRQWIAEHPLLLTKYADYMLEERKDEVRNE